MANGDGGSRNDGCSRGVLMERRQRDGGSDWSSPKSSTEELHSTENEDTQEEKDHTLVVVEVPEVAAVDLRFLCCRRILGRQKWWKEPGLLFELGSRPKPSRCPRRHPFCILPSRYQEAHGNPWYRRANLTGPNSTSWR
ncbi:UNVERIFIED_CONTAM: hypothetical protein K2H54_011957 [Gekko kuhli]